MTQAEEKRLLGYLVALLRSGFIERKPWAFQLCEPVKIQ